VTYLVGETTRNNMSKKKHSKNSNNDSIGRSKEIKQNIRNNT